MPCLLTGQARELCSASAGRPSGRVHSPIGTRKSSSSYSGRQSVPRCHVGSVASRNSISVVAANDYSAPITVSFFDGRFPGRELGNTPTENSRRDHRKFASISGSVRYRRWLQTQKRPTTRAFCALRSRAQDNMNMLGINGGEGVRHTFECRCLLVFINVRISPTFKWLFVLIRP
jgi:hypothetical protein